MCIRDRLGDAQQVGGADNHQEHGRRHPCRNRREPVVYEFAHHGQLNHRDEDVIEPVVPTGDEAGALGPVASGVVAERARLRILNGCLLYTSRRRSRPRCRDCCAESSGGRESAASRQGHQERLGDYVEVLGREAHYVH